MAHHLLCGAHLRVAPEQCSHAGGALLGAAEVGRQQQAVHALCHRPRVAAQHLQKLNQRHHINHTEVSHGPAHVHSWQLWEDKLSFCILSGLAIKYGSLRAAA